MEEKATSTVAIIAAVAVALIGGAVTLFGNSEAMQEFSRFIVMAMPLFLVLQNRKTDKVADQNDKMQEDVNAIKVQTNGRLDNKFSELHDRLDAAGIPSVEPITGVVTAVLDGPDMHETDSSEFTTEKA